MKEDALLTGFTFDEFLDAMTATHLARIRHPRETVVSGRSWMYRWIPAWRWIQAHFLHDKRGNYNFSNADEHTLYAFDLLLSRSEKRICHPGVIPLIDAILIYERNGRDRWLLESHLLLPEMPPNLAAKLGLSQATIDYYELWFFDVRRWLTKSTWIACEAIGPAIFGYADDDLAPIWKRMAYCGNERILDIAVAVTTGTGRNLFTDEECDAAQYHIESLRLSPLRDADAILRLERRLKAEQNGEHPSSFHRPRRRKNARDVAVGGLKGASSLREENSFAVPIGECVFS